MNKNDDFLHQVKSDDLISRLREEIDEYVKNNNIRYWVKIKKNRAQLKIIVKKWVFSSILINLIF